MTVAEDFVSFETARLLKDKEFNASCVYAWCEKGGWNKYTRENDPIVHILRTDGNPFGSYYTGKNWNKPVEGHNKNRILCSAPTHALVLKWLRLVHNIVLDIGFASLKPTWVYRIIKNGDTCKNYLDGHPSPEEATEAAIQYCLKELL